MRNPLSQRGARSLAAAAALGAIAWAGAGCSTEEQAAVGTIEMGKADKNNLMSFGGGGDAGGAASQPASGGRGRGRGRADSGGFVKSIKGGGGGAAP